MTVRHGITSDTPDRIMIDAGAVYINYGLPDERLLGATRGGNEFTLNRTVKNMEVDGIKGAVKGLKRIIEINPQITANLLELSVANLILAIAGANQSDQAHIENEYVGVGNTVLVRFTLNQDDIIENSEIIYLAADGGAVTALTRSNPYNSRFVGTYAIDNKEFEESIGDWAKADVGDTIEVVSGGKVGNCMKFTAGANSAAGFLTLDAENGAVLTNLVVGEHYFLRIAIKKGGQWTGGGAVTILCDAGTEALTLTTSFIVYVIEFTATGTDAGITLTGAGAPDSGDICYIDCLELKKVDGDYVMDYLGGKVIIANNDIPSAAENILASYDYAKTTPNQTTITGGDIGDDDYIDNVAIVGNVTGKTYPVVCIIKNALADTGFSIATAPRDEVVTTIVFSAHFLPTDLDTEPWEIRYPNS